MGLFPRGALSICLLFTATWSELACAEDVMLKTDQTSLLMLSAEPGTIVIGNPGIADVTLNGKQLFMHGKAPGSTNLMILDTNGNKLADMYVSVSNDSRNLVSVYSGSLKGQTARSTFSCVPDCEPAMVAGDSGVFLQDTIAGNISRSSFATGTKKTNETTAPKPPQ